MSSRRLAMAAMVLPVLAAAGRAQETKEQTAPLEAQQAPDGRLRMRLLYSIWTTDLHFDASTPAERVEVDLAALHGPELVAQLELSEQWALEARVAYTVGPKTDALVAYVGGLRRLWIFDDPWTTAVRGGFLYGTFDISEAPGAFDNGFGLEAAATLGRPLSERWSIDAELALRLLKFKFDADPDVTESDDSIGGFGVRVLAGLEYHF